MSSLNKLNWIGLDNFISPLQNIIISYLVETNDSLKEFLVMTFPLSSKSDSFDEYFLNDCEYASDLFDPHLRIHRFKKTWSYEVCINMLPTVVIQGSFGSLIDLFQNLYENANNQKLPLHCSSGSACAILSIWKMITDLFPQNILCFKRNSDLVELQIKKWQCEVDEFFL